MKKYFYSLITIIVLLAFIAIVSYIGTINPEFNKFIDISYKVFILIMFASLIYLTVTWRIPKLLKNSKIKRKMTKEEYQTLKDFILIQEPADEEAEFITFSDTNLAVHNIITSPKYNLNLDEPLYFKKDEIESIKKYRKLNTEESQEICNYYDKCEEVINIINKYYDEKGNLKN